LNFLSHILIYPQGLLSIQGSGFILNLSIHATNLDKVTKIHVKGNNDYKNTYHFRM